MASEWFYNVGGQKRGPVGSADLKRLADSGVLKPTDLVWKEGLAAWVAASSIKGLFPQPDKPSPPPPPPVAPVARPAPATAPASGLHPQRLVAGIAAAIGGVATFLPWATVPIMGTIDGTAGDGWITLGLFVGVLAAAFLGPRSQQMAGLAQLGGIVLSTIAGGIGVTKILHFRHLIAGIKADAAPGSLEGAMKGLMANATRLGPGLYVLVIASVAAIVAIVALRSKRDAATAATPLPIHVQRIVVIVLALAGAAGTFMPWAGPVDSEPAVKIDASRSPAEGIARSRASNRKYRDEMAKYLGKKAETLRDITSSSGTAFSGWFTLALFATTALLAIRGVRRSPLRGPLLALAAATPLAAAGLGAWEVVKAGNADKAVRAASLEAARENGLEEAATRLSRPVIKVEAGLWVVIASGVAAAVAGAILGRVGSEGD
jgi:hypothetical protein